MSQQPVLAVVSVLGKDQKGVVAQFATYMAERGINIEDIEQRVVRGFFVMDMLVDLKDLSTDLSELITGLLDIYALIFGIFLIRQLMDQVEFNERGNSIKMVLFSRTAEPARRVGS